MSHSANERTNDKWTTADVSSSLLEQQLRNNSGGKSKSHISVMHLCLADVVKRLFLLFGFIHLLACSKIVLKTYMRFMICVTCLNLVKDSHSLSKFWIDNWIIFHVYKYSNQGLWLSVNLFLVWGTFSTVVDSAYALKDYPSMFLVFKVWKRD